MSRVLFVSLDEGQVVARCLAEKVGISAIERLPGGGVRFVCMTRHTPATPNANRRITSSSTAVPS